MKRAPLIILFVTLFLDLLGFSIILPLLPVYIKHYGGSPIVGGLLLASFSCMQFLFSPIWGRMSDKYGRRPMMLLSLIGSAVSYFCFGAAPNLVVLFLARISAGVLSAASLPTAQAYIADVTTPDKRAGGMAMIGASFGLGFAFGPILGGYLSQHPVFGIPPLAMPSYFAASLALINFAFALFLLPETHHDRSVTIEDKGPFAAFTAIARAMKQPSIRAELIVFGFVTFAFTAVESSFSWLINLRFHDQILKRAIEEYEANGHVFAALSTGLQRQLEEKAATATTATIFSIVGVTILVVQGAVMGGLAKRLGETFLVRVGAMVLTITLLGIAFSHSLPMIWIFSAMIALGSGILNPSLTSLITKGAGPQERGTISGAQQGLGSAARIIAPPINNALIQFYSPVPFVFSAVLMFVAFGLSMKLRPAEVERES